MTPAEDLIGSASNHLPITDFRLPLNTKFRLIQQTKNDFLDAWKRDYLVTIQKRKKNSRTAPKFSVMIWH